jgi:hypothetical protein
VLRALLQRGVEGRVGEGVRPGEVEVERHVPWPARRREGGGAGSVAVEGRQEGLDVVRDEGGTREGEVGAPELCVRR